MPNTALCIGINYAGTDAALAGCVNDATDWADLLAQNGFAVASLHELQATRAAILAGIRNRLAAAGPGGVCAVVFAGHGSYAAASGAGEPDGRDELWCPYDYRAAGCISDDEIAQVIADHGVGVRVVVYADSCFGGGMLQLAIEAMPGAHPRRPRFLPPTEVLAGAARDRALAARGLPFRAKTAELLFAACSEAEYAYDGEFDGRANGAFTYCAINAFVTLPAGASYAAWMDVIRNYLPSAVYPQHPVIDGPASLRAHPALT